MVFKDFVRNINENFAQTAKVRGEGYKRVKILLEQGIKRMQVG